ncbi:two-component sensor histidine kinase [Virgisporangium aliadipatigenens]|uniref:histidine kinase n=1 Tax=Virgisporangium aliadipatigenens TaxID=741659 RepID=A0A8J3YEC0_9ACTN|nr:histidine kinase [Virgisporangium aliadipatigenens]GIJ43441.1 two-component sensor histidine kinase [Virgisporangium aliadipatigenens]
MRLLPRPVVWVDAAVALTAVAVTLVTTGAAPAGGRLDAYAWLVAGVAGGVLVLRRRCPFATLLIATLAAEAYLLHQWQWGQRGSMVLSAPLVALYTYAEASTRRFALLVGGAVVLGIGVMHVFVKPGMWIGTDNLALAALGALAVAAGTAARHRRAYLAEAQARAIQAENDREAEALRRVTDERLRIARDLHDALGHHLALIHVQARVATHTLDSAESPAAQALGHISAASKAALIELGDTIGLLRQPGDPAAPTDPVGGLDRLGDLTDAFRRSGLDVSVEVAGEARPVSGPTDLTAYRVVQESLTNVCKHAGPTTVTIGLTYRPEALEITVDNRATGHPGVAGAGHGLTGMRERVTALGGAFQAGPAPGGRYRVRARLPLGTAGAAA